MYKKQYILGLGSLFIAITTLQACYQAVSKEQGISVGPNIRISKKQSLLSDTLPPSFGFGRQATQAEIARLDIDVRPDGKGLPAGNGIASKGKVIFETKCVACHGVGGIGGINGSLVTNKKATDKRKEKTIGNYWPYATTVFDYIRRAMPFNQPGSLSNEEVYNLTAYLLHANEIIDDKTVINAQTLPKVEMPAKNLFVPDDRKGGPEIK
ncbi:c-type cytochrome [Flectobacillus major]|jgi:cytochrome c|uniref:c-type cytochrome n=1 Tax=Flectobacillus major TaxID=103 RepID=UPI0004182984|nr:cytochrome c [Flectobacillus major]